jgi:general secretion pathway protein G
MRHHEMGFTIVELLIVIAIIGIIAAIAVPNLLMSLQRAKMNRTWADFRAISTAIGVYMLDNNFYPIATRGRARPRLEVLTPAILPQKYYNGPLKDSWGTDIYYSSDQNGQNYRLVSFGKDGSRTSYNPATARRWEDPWRFRSSTCRRIPYENILRIIREGCDLIVVNGQQAGKRP